MLSAIYAKKVITYRKQHIVHKPDNNDRYSMNHRIFCLGYNDSTIGFFFITKTFC